MQSSLQACLACRYSKDKNESDKTALIFSLIAKLLKLVCRSHGVLWSTGELALEKQVRNQKARQGDTDADARQTSLSRSSWYS